MSVQIFIHVNFAFSHWFSRNCGKNLYESRAYAVLINCMSIWFSIHCLLHVFFQFYLNFNSAAVTECWCKQVSSYFSFDMWNAYSTCASCRSLISKMKGMSGKTIPLFCFVFIIILLFKFFFEFFEFFVLLRLSQQGCCIASTSSELSDDQCHSFRLLQLGRLLVLLHG